MPQRVVIHAGFHKTGTTTVQKTLHKNGPVLWPVTAIGLRWRLKDLLYAARGYSTWRDPLSLMKFEHRFDKYLRSLDLGPKRRLCLSAEELSGHLPGRGDLEDYSAAPDLMAEIARVLERHFPELDLAFLFSTRAPEPWLRSAYWEHVKASRMVLNFDAFHARYHGAADLPGMAARVADAVAPHKVVTYALEDCANLRLGPADPLIDLLDLPPARRAALVAQPPANAARPAGVLEAFLELNRSDLTSPEVGEAKRAILAGIDGKEATA